VEGRQAKQLTTGMLLVTIGLIFLGEQLQPGSAWDIGRLWPVIIIVIGLGRFLSPRERSRGSGVWFLLIGVLFLMNNYHVMRLRQSWPLFIVAGGVSILMGWRTEGRVDRSSGGETDGR
jgi:LiaF transmembrane domain